MPALRMLLAAAPLVALTLTAQIRPVPPPGVPVPDADKTQLAGGLKRLGAAIERLRTSGQHGELLPDVEIFYKAVDYALRYDEFFKAEDIFRAKELLRQGQERAAALEQGDAPWATASGLVVRGYVSKIDGSVQPYGLVLPSSYSPS